MKPFAPNAWLASTADWSRVAVRTMTGIALIRGLLRNRWAACIGGAAQQQSYRDQIEAAGLRVETIEENPSYQFISDNARAASKKFGVKSVSVLAFKP